MANNLTIVIYHLLRTIIITAPPLLDFVRYNCWLAILTHDQPMNTQDRAESFFLGTLAWTHEHWKDAMVKVSFLIKVDFKLGYWRDIDLPQLNLHVFRLGAQKALREELNGHMSAGR